jgi:hypothetical protein
MNYCILKKECKTDWDISVYNSVNDIMSIQTLEQLKRGELKGATKIKLSCELKQFPEELFQLTDTLEVLDLSGNQLSSLPKDFTRFKKLKIAFFSDNLFTEFPEVLGACAALQMIGFKANKIAHVPENSIPVGTRWLILTNNCIEQLPHSIGKCNRLQKVMFAGNNLTHLPDEMQHCQNIELLRISANNISELPVWLFSLPRLSWLAYAANPCCRAIADTSNLKHIRWEDIQLEEQLGEGASGFIYKASVNNEAVAVKVFKGEVTSDGLPQSELFACEAAGVHSNLTTVLGEVRNHPQNKQGLVLELIAKEFKNLGNPPSFETCTRDTFADTLVFTIQELLKITSGIASALTQLHERGIMHGDVYAHNILIDHHATPLLSDFGAATVYDTHSAIAESLEKLDVRAFGCLLEDVLCRTKYASEDNLVIAELRQLVNECMQPEVLKRPMFESIYNKLNGWLLLTF